MNKSIQPERCGNSQPIGCPEGVGAGATNNSAEAVLVGINSGASFVIQMGRDTPKDNRWQLGTAMLQRMIHKIRSHFRIAEGKPAWPVVWGAGVRISRLPDSLLIGLRCMERM